MIVDPCQIAQHQLSSEPVIEKSIYMLNINPVAL